MMEARDLPKAHSKLGACAPGRSGGYCCCCCAIPLLIIKCHVLASRVPFNWFWRSKRIKKGNQPASIQSVYQPGPSSAAASLLAGTSSSSSSAKHLLVSTAGELPLSAKMQGQVMHAAADRALCSAHNINLNACGGINIKAHLKQFQFT